MAEKDKKYYWLKLKNDFFKRHDIKIIEDMPNGKDYILFYLKLLVESVGHEGELRFSETIPYNENMLSTITNTNIDIVRSAIKLFTELALMEIFDDGTIYLQEVQKMIGHETYWAGKKREQKLKNPMNSLKVGKSPTQVQLVQQKSKQEIEKEIDIELEIEKESSSNEVLVRIFKTYEQEIGMVTPILSDDIEFYLTELKEEIILKAISEASQRNIKNWKYIKAILDRCIKENIKTLPDYESKSKKKTKTQEYEYETKEIDLDALTRGYS